MKKLLTLALVAAVTVSVLFLASGWTLKRTDPKIAKFNADCDNLILGLQQYKEFVGTYPSGANKSIANSLLGQTDKKVLILAVRRSDLNDKGEIMDPWGTPLQFYFSHNEVMIRSAGPNKAWEDSATAEADDLYRCAGKDRSH